MRLVCFLVMYVFDHVLGILKIAEHFNDHVVCFFKIAENFNVERSEMIKTIS